MDELTSKALEGLFRRQNAMCPSGPVKREKNNAVHLVSVEEVSTL